MASCAVIPVLGHEYVAKATGWLRDAFGFGERWRAGTSARSSLSAMRPWS